MKRYNLKKFVKYPPHIVVWKILKKIGSSIRIEFNSLKANLFSTYISEEEFANSLKSPYQDVDLLLKHLGNREQPEFFFNPSDRNEIVETVKSYYTESIDKTIKDSDKICKHIFDLLGSGTIQLGEKIDWHTDFKTGWTWKPKYYKKVYYGNLDNPYDVKVPWELSRCQHFVTLGKAYWYTDDERYAEEFVFQISDWIDSNPPKFGVNWACTMDVAIRVVNWIWGYYFFKNSPMLTDNFMLKFLKSILAHRRHIISNLENKGRFTSNHYLSNIVGLIYLGVMFPEFKEAKEWREFGINELI